MNFFCIAFFLTSLQINISWWGNYLIKLVGMLFFVGGVLEISGFNKSFKRFLMPSEMLSSVSAVATVVFSILSFKNASVGVLNVTGAVTGTIVTLTTLGFQKMLLKDISADGELVNDMSQVGRFVKSWDWLAILTIVNLVCDILNRLVSVKVVADTAGLLMAISKILMYIFALVILFRANKVRVDFNKKHGA